MNGKKFTNSLTNDIAHVAKALRAIGRVVRIIPALHERVRRANVARVREIAH
jgi:hypothetical protein